MPCSACGASISDPQTQFCPRCGAPQGVEEGAATQRLGAGTEDARTEDARLEDERTAAEDEFFSEGDDHRGPNEDTLGVQVDDDPGIAEGPGGPLTGMFGVGRDAAASLGRSYHAAGWHHAVMAAAIGFLGILAAGAAFMLASKLVIPDLGSGRSPLWVFSRIIVAGLFSIGVPVERAGEMQAVLPLGAVALVGWVIVWASRSTTMRSGALTSRERLTQGLKIGVPFGLLCLIAALIFRLRGGDVETGASPLPALLIGLFWGAAFGALGGFLAGTRLRIVRGRAMEVLEAKRRTLWEGAIAAGTAGATLGILCAAVVLLYLIFMLAFGPVSDMSAASALAFVIAFLAFLPNAVLGAMTFVLGAPFELLATTLDGREAAVGYSLLGIGRPAPPPYTFVLVLIPLFAGVLGGYAARRKTRSPDRWWETLGVAAAMIAVPLALLSFLARISLGRAFLGTGNYLVVEASPFLVLLLTALWMFGAGLVGWKLAERDQTAARARIKQRHEDYKRRRLEERGEPPT